MSARLYGQLSLDKTLTLQAGSSFCATIRIYIPVQCVCVFLCVSVSECVCVCVCVWMRNVSGVIYHGKPFSGRKGGLHIG